MESILLYISTIINALLIVAIFFKSSLNEIITEYFRDKIEMRNKRREATNTAYSIAKKLKTTTFIVLVDFARRGSQSNTGEDRKDYLEEFGRYNSEIESIELYLPSEAIKSYNKFKDMVKNFGSEISREGTNNERLIEIGKILEKQSKQLMHDLASGFK